MAHSMLLPCQGLLLDCDGVLVDSADSINGAWQRWAEHYGLPAAEVLRFVHGRRSIDTVQSFLSEGSWEEAHARVQQYELDTSPSVSALSGAAALVRSLPVGRWAAVTSGTRVLATARLRAAGLPIPSVFVTAEDVDRPKPAPDAYIKAARDLGLASSSTVAVEDSAIGVAAARAAGAFAVVGVGARATGADLCVADLTGVLWHGEGLSISHAALKKHS